LRVPALSSLNLFSGGGQFEINAYTKFHGPSWRMIVELSDETNAHGVYPGGQSGNPGSRYYDNFIGTWLSGKYYTLKIMRKEQMEKTTQSSREKYHSANHNY